MPRSLTAMAVANAKADPERRREIADGAAPGLRLVIQPSGSKSFAFRYERAGGGGAKVTLGPAAGPGALSLAAARQRISDMRREMNDGTDPAVASKARKTAAIRAEQDAREAAASEARKDEGRIDVVLDRYLERHVAGLKSADEVRRLFKREVRPAWGNRLVGDLRRHDVAALVDGIAGRGARTTANRTFANVRAWLGWCVEKGIIESSPAERMRPPGREFVRDRVLNDGELARLQAAINRLDWPWRQFFSIAVLTAQRREELAGMRWKELDLDAREPVWVLPASRTKNGREHAVPLVPQVVDLLNAIPRMAKSPFVFTTTGETPISGFSRAKASLDKLASNGSTEPLAPWRLHDLRRSAASGMARLGVTVAVVEKVLNHVSGTFAGIVSVYQRHDYAAEKRDALERWADHLDRLQRRSCGHDASSSGVAVDIVGTVADSQSQ